MGHVTPLFARQPIYDRELHVIAYELLFRGGLDSISGKPDGDQATSHVLLYAFGQHKIEEITGRLPAYINYTRHWLVFPPPLPPSQLVIEILEDVKPDAEVLQAIVALRKQGYQIALDDFFINPDTHQFLAHADIIKIDVLALDESQWQSYVQYLRPYGVKLLAEKIETFEMFERCRALGFDFFQGYFLAKPHTIQGLKIPDEKNAVLQKLTIVTNPRVNADKVIATIQTDPQLGRRLITLVGVTYSEPVHTLEQAVVAIGLNQVRNWAAFLLLNSHAQKSRELWIMSLTRARFCELTGRKIGGRALAETCFSAGILSLFDACLDIPLRVLLASLSLQGEVSLALTERLGNCGQALDLVLRMEQAQWQDLHLNPLLQDGKISEDDIIRFYSDSLSWAQDIIRQSY